MLNPDNVVNLGVRGGVNLGGGVCKSMKRGSG